MKNTYLLDKIFNANHHEFEEIIKAVVIDIEQQNFPYTFFKKEDKWIIDIEKEDTLISVKFDDYEMEIYNSAKDMKAMYSNHWKRIFFKFLTKKQKLQYESNLNKIEDNKNKTI